MKTTENTPMHVMVLASGDLWAGAEAVVYELVRGLHAFTGTRVTAVYLNEGRLAELTRAAGVETYVVEEGRHSFPSIAANLALLTRRLKPRIIHSHRYKENILAALCAPAGGLPRLVTTQHGITETASTPRLRSVQFLETLLLRHCFSRVVAVSQDLEGYLISGRGVPGYRVGQVYNGIDTDGATPERRSNGGRVVVGSAGRLVGVKDFGLMVDIAREVCAKRQDVDFVLAGEGPERAQLEEQVRASGLKGRLTLLGHVHDIAGFFSSLDIYLNTSKHEGIPMTVLEAMKNRLPVVVPDVGGMGEIVVHDRTGCLVRGRDAASFAEVLLALAGSPARREELGTEALGRIKERFSTRAMVQSYQALYRDVLGVPG